MHMKTPLTAVLCVLFYLATLNPVRAVVCENPVKIAGQSSANYTSITSAYAAAGSGDVIELSGERSYLEDVILDNVGVSLSGGWDCNHTTQSLPFSKIYGTLIIAGTGETTVENIAIFPTAAPPMPSNLQGTALSPSSIRLTWNDNSLNETGFRVRYGPMGTGGRWWPDLSANTTTVTITGLSSNTPYLFYVVAFNSAGVSAQTDTVIVATLPLIPDAPTNLHIVPIDKSSTGLRLSWTDNSKDESGFKIRRSTTLSGTYTDVATVGVNVTTWDDNNLDPCTTYYYQVYAFSNDGNSKNETGSSKTAPAAPTGLVASNGLPLLGIYLDWNANACAASYRIYECDNAAYSYRLLGTAPANKADITGTTPGIYLFYRVSSLDSSGHEGNGSCVTKTGASWGGATSANDTCHAAVGWAASPKPANAWASLGNYVKQIIIGWNPVQLTWNYNGQGSNTYATNYNIAYSLDATGDYSTMTWTPLQDRVVSSTSSAPVSMTINTDTTNYWIHFRINAAGYSGYPAYVSGWAAPSSGSTSTKPATPLITVSEYYPNLIMVGWSAVSGATSYEVRRATSSGGPFTTIRNFNGSTTSFINSTSDASYPISTGVNYWYSVRVNVNGYYSDWSAAEMGNAVQFLP